MPFEARFPQNYATFMCLILFFFQFKSYWSQAYVLQRKISSFPISVVCSFLFGEKKKPAEGLGSTV